MSNINYWKELWTGVGDFSPVVNTQDLLSPVSSPNPRPSWDKIYEGFPKTIDGKAQSPQEVFSSVFGSIYNPTEETIEINGKKISMINACATRMSLALLNANYNLNSKRDFLCQTGKYRGKGIITKIKKMRDYLFESIGSPDIFISTEDEKSPYYGRTRQISEEEVRKIIGYKNGIYLVYRPGAYTDANGHVSLWLKREMNTIDNPDTGVIGELCFWELT